MMLRIYKYKSNYFVHNVISQTMNSIKFTLNTIGWNGGQPEGTDHILVLLMDNVMSPESSSLHA